jgi:hypothetical protein
MKPEERAIKRLKRMANKQRKALKDVRNDTAMCRGSYLAYLSAIDIIREEFSKGGE